MKSEKTDAVQVGPDPLRIGFRVGRYPALSETFVASQIADMESRGHSVSVLADELAAPESGSATPHRLLSTTPRNPLLAKGLAAMPWRVRRAWISGAERRWANNIDVMVCNFGWFGAQIAHSLRSHPNPPPFVTIFHGDDVSRSLRQGERIYNEVFDRCDLMLAVSALWRSRLISLGAPAHKVRVHRMGVDLSQHAFDPGRAAQPVRKIIHVGRLVEKKGTEYLLRAMALARREMPARALTLEIVGSGPLDTSLKRLSEELGLVDSVRFLGPLDHGAVCERLAGADLFVLPSVTAADGDMEGIPVALMEAMASGIPVISTRHSGIPELIQDGTDGLLATERDPADLFRQIRRVVQGHDERIAMAANARKTIEQRFNRDKLHDALQEILAGLARNPRRSQSAGGAVGVQERAAPFPSTTAAAER